MSFGVIDLIERLYVVAPRALVVCTNSGVSTAVFVQTVSEMYQGGISQDVR